MPFGEFLEDFPTAVFVSTHVLMLGLGIWAIVRTRGAQRGCLTRAPVVCRESTRVFRLLGRADHTEDDSSDRADADHGNGGMDRSRYPARGESSCLNLALRPRRRPDLSLNQTNTNAAP